jgi:hypothetical protein
MDGLNVDEDVTEETIQLYAGLINYDLTLLQNWTPR